MSPSEEPPVWLVPLILVAFPVLFAAIWALVCLIISFVSGYRSLLTYRDERARTKGEALPTPWYAMLGLMSYRGGTLSFRSSPEGLSLVVSKLFPFHPPIRVPWDRVREDSAEAGGLFRRLAGSSLVIDGRVTLRVPEETRVAICVAKQRYAA